MLYCKKFILSVNYQLIRPFKISKGSRDITKKWKSCLAKIKFDGHHKWAASWQNQQNGMCTRRRLRSAWASVDAQADLSLRWVTCSFCWFCHEAAQLRLTACGGLLINNFFMPPVCLIYTKISQIMHRNQGSSWLRNLGRSDFSLQEK